MIDLDNQTNLEIDLESLETILKELTSKDIELIIVENETMSEINKEHRNKDSSTDVLSFPMEFDYEHMPLGSIIISCDYVKDKAKKFGHSLQDETTLLFIHGLLHLLGFDHEVDNGEHRAKEEYLIKKYNLPKSLIVRNS